MAQPALTRIKPILDLKFSLPISFLTFSSTNKHPDYSEKAGDVIHLLLFEVDATGFEPATSASRTQRSTKLSHASLSDRFLKSILSSKNESRFILKVPTLANHVFYLTSR